MSRRAIAALAALLLQATACKRAGPREEALERAIQARDLEAVRSAIAAGADPNVRPPGGSGARNFPWLVELEMQLYPRQADALEPIAAAVFEGGGSPNVQTGSGPRAVYLVERYGSMGRLGLVDAMIKAGLEVRSEGAGRALISAARAGHTAVVERLVAAGVDANVHWWRFAGQGAETPLSEAVLGRHTDTIEALERAGAREW